MLKRILKRLLVILIPIICIPIILSALVSWISGQSVLDYGRYFAVDEAGRVYLGVGYYIHIYDDSVLVDRLLVGRGCSFTVEDNEIIVYNGEDTIHYTLDGTETSREKGTAGLIYKQYRYISGDGTEYRIRYPFGRFSVFEEDSNISIYQMPLQDYVFGVGAIISMTVLAAWCCYMTFKLLDIRLFSK